MEERNIELERVIESETNRKGERASRLERSIAYERVKKLERNNSTERVIDPDTTHFCRMSQLI